MAYDDDLAERVREELADEPGLTERKMFGGLAFMVNGNMCCGVTGDELMIRIPPDETDETLEEPGVRPMDMTGRPMKGWIVVGGEAIGSEAGLAQWVDRSRRFAHSLPPKRAR